MWSCVAVCILAALVGSTYSEPSESRLVHIDSGPVRGYKDATDDVFVFYGIPYATAPSGTKKFRAPLPAPVWLEPLEAVDKGIICPQLSVPLIKTDTKTMQEDCLIANVYVPSTTETNLPVVVYVHGGGFIIGYGNMLELKKLVGGKKVIAVTFNYRLSAHGFLCLGTEDAPGNSGMKDQVALLRWVKQNIASFGGNPNDVTIAGGSAGSISVDLIMISKMAKGLFNKVIPESGSNLSPFTVQVDPVEYAKEYATLLNYAGEDDVYELQDFFQNISYELLQSGNTLNKTGIFLLMTPCVERDIGEERFLEDSPINILKKGDFEKVPVLYGFANMEGLIHLDNFNTSKDKMNDNFADFLPQDLQFSSDEDKNNVADDIKTFYFGDEPVDDDKILDYINYFTDTMFACPTLWSIKLQLKAKSSQLYLYEYSYTDDDTPVVPHTNVRGANHCAQTLAIFDGANITNFDETFISEDLRKMKSILRELWQNFIINGKPESSRVPAWPPVGLDWSPHMNLKLAPELQGSLLKERCLFWEKIYNKYYAIPSPPPLYSPKHSEL